MALQDTLDQIQNLDFNDLDFNNIGSWPTVIKVALMAVLFSAVLGGGYYYYLIDKQDTGFTVHLEAAPGNGNSVVFDWHLIR